MTLLRFIISTLYSLAGISGFIAFIILKNYSAAVLAILTGFINLVCSHIHFLNYKQKLQEWYSPQHLLQISRFGFYTFALGISVLIYFSVVEIMLKKPILPIHDSAIIPIIWSFITLKSGLILLWYAVSYTREDQRPLIEETNDEAQNGNEIIDP